MWEDEGQDEQGEMASPPPASRAVPPSGFVPGYGGVGLLTRHSYRWSLLTELDACGGDGRRRAAMGGDGRERAMRAAMESGYATV